MRDLAIVGNHPDTEKYVPWNSDVEIWAFNEPAMRLPRVDLAFQIHSYVEPNINYEKWLSERKVITRDIYPFDDIFALTSKIYQGIEKEVVLQYLTSTPSMALALTALQKRSPIYIYGMEFTGGGERKSQREGFIFWTGFLGGIGTELHICCADGIFKQPIYGDNKK